MICNAIKIKYTYDIHTIIYNFMCQQCQGGFRILFILIRYSRNEITLTRVPQCIL